MNRFASSLLIGALVLAGHGCYRTVVRSGAPMTGVAHYDRQWFTLAGLVGFSPPAGKECLNGIAFAESEMSAMDVLINLSVAVAGGAVGALACDIDDEDHTAQVACINGFATVAPMLLSTRTVWYGCAAAPPPPIRRVPGSPSGTAPGLASPALVPVPLVLPGSATALAEPVPPATATAAAPGTDPDPAR